MVQLLYSIPEKSWPSSQSMVADVDRGERPYLPVVCIDMSIWPYPVRKGYALVFGLSLLLRGPLCSSWVYFLSSPRAGGSQLSFRVFAVNRVWIQPSSLYLSVGAKGKADNIMLAYFSYFKGLARREVVT